MPPALTDFGYQRALRPHEALVDLVVDNPLRLRADLAGAAVATGRRHDLTVRMARGILVDMLADERPGVLVRHLVVVRDTPYDPAVVAAVTGLLGAPYHSASLVFAYPSPEQASSAVPLIEEAKRRTCDRLNLIRPDTTGPSGWLTVSDAKVCDNLVADSVRVKYRPRRLGATLPATARAAAASFFDAATAVYVEHHLFHRASTDGCFAVRYGDGLLITATRTGKAAIEPDRVVLVHEYHEPTNTLVYSGAALPSSDSVEVAVLAAAAPWLHGFVHTHASDLITRNRAFPYPVRVPAQPYGEPALGHALVAALAAAPPASRSGVALAVIEDHGEVFAGETTGAPFFDAIRVICEEARAWRLLDQPRHTVDRTCWAASHEP